MPQIETTQTATAFNTDIDNDTLNPSTDANTDSKVYITLHFHGVAFDPNALYDALDSAYGTVSSNRVPARNTYEFDIRA